MAIPQVDQELYPTPEELLNQYLSDLRYGYARAGVTANVSRGSEPYIRGKALMQRLSQAIQNNKLSTADISPLNAQDEKLEELAAVFGVTPREASAAAGLVRVTVVGGGSIALPVDFLATAPNGIEYATTQSLTLANNEYIEVQAQSTGKNTELAANVVLTWNDSSIGNLGQNAVVGAGGIDGGEDKDDLEVLRARLIRRLSQPSVGGNAAQVLEWAEDSTAAVEAAFVYPAVRGPASYDLAITGKGGDRTLSATHVATAATAVLNNMPGHADLNTTSVSQQLVDVIINLELPLPVSAGGAGGGWRDTVPWPSTTEVAGTFAEVTSIANLSSGRITVNSFQDPPVIGKHFGIWDPATDQMREFTISNVTGAAGAYEITINPDVSDPYSFITTGMYCSAGAVSLRQYGTTMLKALEALGPGQKSDSVFVMPRARRRPGADVEWPSNLTMLQLDDLAENNKEVLDVEYAGRFATGTKNPLTGPSLPSTSADAPRILVLQNLSFRRRI